MGDDVKENGKRRGGCLKTFVIVLVTVLLLAAASVWVVKAYIFPSDFKPVELSADEDRELAAKLGHLEPEAIHVEGLELGELGEGQQGNDSVAPHGCLLLGVGGRCPTRWGERNHPLLTALCQE